MNKSQLPFISVVIPVYNIENYISLCLHSVIVQTLSNIEIIVINDASTDNSLNIIQQFAAKDKRIIVINNNKNLGLSATRNVGIKLAKGKYVHFLDGDDYLSPYAYQDLYEYALLNQLDILLFAHFRIRGNKTKRYNINYKLRAYGQKVFTTHKDKLLLIKNKIGVTVWNKLFRTNFLLENNLFFKNGCIFEDVLFFWQTITKANAVSFLNIPVYYYITRSNSIFNNIQQRNDLDIIEIMDSSYKFMLDNNYLEVYGEVFTDKLLKTYITFFKFTQQERKKTFFTTMQNSLTNMQLTPYISNKNKKRLYLIQKLPFNIFRWVVKCKIIR